MCNLPALVLFATTAGFMGSAWCAAAGTAGSDGPHDEPVADTRCYVDGHGRFVVDGRPFFPRASWLPGGKDLRGTDEDFERTFARLAEADFNLAVGPWRSDDSLDARLGAYLDAAHRHGIKVAVLVVPYDWELKLSDDRALFSDPEFLRSISRLIHRVKGHPAVALWLPMDEPEGKVKADDLSQLNDHINSVDGKHPIWYNIGPALEYWAWKGPYIHVSDVFSIDRYPFGRDPIQILGKSVDSAKARTQDRPFWFWVQGGEIEKGHVPTERHIRFMAYQVIVHGATGIGFFKPEQTHPGFEDPHGLWACQQRINAELIQLEDVLLAPGAWRQTSPKGRPEHVEVWRKGPQGRECTVALNCSDKEARLPEYELELGPYEVVVLSKDRDYYGP